MTRSIRPAGPAALRPSAPERARTVASRPAAAICAAGIDGSRVLAHTTTAAGQVLLVVPTDGEVCTAVRGSADGDLAALLLVTDHAPVPLHDAVRAQVWLSGWLTPVDPADRCEALLAFADAAPVGALLDVGATATLLSLDLAEVVLGECGAVTELDPEDYLAAAPDPLAEVEATMLQHLDESHPEQLALLASRVPREWVAGGVVRPLGLDRFGFRLRVEQPGGHRDVRVPFPVPVSGPEELGAAVQRLLCAAERSCPGR
ncbi:DUF2470 domain-containing protein [Modestobacter sp. VKM Ac-2986]|uniref:DUF2470 domain-containing protein n=1 Tax=Modestobacter sp. VKM Ac-2986 TaxID=3004140 RepID=UPI0022AAE280|nr:DUF2470 domain-containing protein [Modestobacter sp. VKM Ac-2986]MCZ2828974.1 DUF2470 domain-containing protein [Modestobacter sp. VKM Ac-2986]